MSLDVFLHLYILVEKHKSTSCFTPNSLIYEFILLLTISLDFILHKNNEREWFEIRREIYIVLKLS